MKSQSDFVATSRKVRHQAKQIYHNVFNWKFGVVSAAVNGVVVVWINWNYGPSEYLYAGLWQALLSFFSTGVTARIIQHFSVMPQPLPSYFLGSFVTGTLTFVASIIVHWFNETPELVQSAMTPALISYTTSFGTNFITRHGYMRPTNYPKDET